MPGYIPFASSEKEGRSLGITCPPDSLPQTGFPQLNSYMNTKEWLQYTKLTILIVNLAVKHGGWGVLPRSLGIGYNLYHRTFLFRY